MLYTSSCDYFIIMTICIVLRTYAHINHEHNKQFNRVQEPRKCYLLYYSSAASTMPHIMYVCLGAGQPSKVYTPVIHPQQLLLIQPVCLTDPLLYIQIHTTNNPSVRSGKRPTFQKKKPQSELLRSTRKWEKSHENVPLSTLYIENGVRGGGC